MTRPLQLTIYRPDDGWRWTLQASNGRVVGSSTEGYARRAAVDANVATVLGLDVTGLKPGDGATHRRFIESHRVGDHEADGETEQTIRVEVR